MVRATRLQRLRIAFAALCASGCDPAPDRDPPAADASQSGVLPDTRTVESSPRGFAVVRGGAELFSKADASASIGTLPVTVAARPDAPGIAAPTSGSVVMVVGAQGDFLAIETLVDPTVHCVDGLGPWSALRVGLFVRKRDLVQVTTRKVEHAFADGTRIILDRGAPLADTATATGERLVDAGGVGLELPVPADALGFYYETAAREIETAPDRVDPAKLSYAQGRPLGSVDVLASDREGVYVYEKAPSDDRRVLVRVGLRCARVWASTDANAMTPAGSGTPEMYAMKIVAEYRAKLRNHSGRTALRFRIRAAAALTWPDGRAAGTAAFEVLTPHTPRTDGARSCVVVPFDRLQTRGSELCMQSGDLESLFAFAVGDGDDGSWPGIQSGATAGRPSVIGGSSRAELGKSTVRGSLPGDALDRDRQRHAIDRKVAESLDGLLSCYDNDLVRDPSLAGSLTLSFVIGPDGTVTSASTEDSAVGSRRVELCVAKITEQLAFPRPAGGGVVDVSYPLAFTHR